MNKRNPEEVLVGISSHLRLLFLKIPMNILIIIVFAKMLHLLNLIIKMHTIQLLIFSNICNLASNSLPFYWLTIIFIYILWSA